jgi:hypothetical protein
MANVLEIEGFLHRGTLKEPFAAYITAPKRSRRKQEYFCWVHAPALFEKDKKIFGIQALQAQELAVQFLKAMLEGTHLTDNAGTPIDLASVLPKSR